MQARATKNLSGKDNFEKFAELKGAFQSPQAFLAFASQTKHLVVLGGLAFALVMTLVALNDIVEEGFHMATALTMIAVAGLWVGSVQALLAVDMQNLVNRLRGENKQLNKANAQLGQECESLQNTSEALHSQVGQFATMRAEMEKVATAQGLQMEDLVSNVTSIFDNLSAMHEAEQKALLVSIAADVEFMDNEAGFDEREFKRFCMRCPPVYKEAIGNDHKTHFSNIAKGKTSIDTNEMLEYFDQFNNNNNSLTNKSI